MKRRAWLSRNAMLAASLAASGLGTAHAEASGRFRIGLTAVILADQVAFLTRWSDYLTARMGHPVAFVVRESYQSILDLLFAGQLDAAWICGYPYVRHQAELNLLVVPQYQNEPTYQSYLIRHRKGPENLRGWGDLKQRVLAYSDPLSNSGWLVPQAQLRAVGLGPQDLRRSFFAHSHRNVAEAVATHLADAGCIDGYVWETMRLQKIAAMDSTHVIWKSAHYGFPPIVVRATEDSAPARRLGEVLLAMQADTLGQPLLNALNLTGFGKSSPALFDSIKHLALTAGSRNR